MLVKTPQIQAPCAVSLTTAIPRTVMVLLHQMQLVLSSALGSCGGLWYRHSCIPPNTVQNSSLGATSQVGLFSEAILAILYISAFEGLPFRPC